MIYTYNGLSYDTSTSERLVAQGQYDAGCERDGIVVIYRTPSGRLWATLDYWSNEFGPADHKVYFGDDQVRSLLNRVQKNHLLVQTGLAALPSA